MVHLTATLGSGGQTCVAQVEEAITIGADAVSVRIEVGGADEDVMLQTLGQVSRDCLRWGMPLFALMHPQPKKGKEEELKAVMRAARIGAEIGADLVRVPYTGSIETFREVVDACPVPLVAIGGEKKVRERDFLSMVSSVMQTGAYGISVGRNVFQYKKPGNMIKAITQIVHKGFSVSTAAAALSEEALESPILGGGVIW